MRGIKVFFISVVEIKKMLFECYGQISYLVSDRKGEDVIFRVFYVVKR